MIWSGQTPFVACEGDGATYVSKLIEVPDEVRASINFDAPGWEAELEKWNKPLAPLSDADELRKLLDDPRVEAMSRATIARAELESIVVGLGEARDLADMVADGAAEPYETAALVGLIEALLENAGNLLESVSGPEALS
jgi:hypothetical protein